MKIVGGYPKNEEEKVKLQLRLFLEAYKENQNIEHLIRAAEICDWHGVSELGIIIVQQLKKISNKRAKNKDLWAEFELIFEALDRAGVAHEEIYRRLGLIKGIDPQNFKREWMARKKNSDRNGD